MSLILTDPTWRKCSGKTEHETCPQPILYNLYIYFDGRNIYLLLGLIFSAESKKPSLIKHACSEPGSHTVKVLWGAGRLTPAPTATTTTTTATTIYNYINNNTNTLVIDNIYKTSTNKSVNDMNSSNNHLRTYSEPFHLWKSGSSFNWKVVTFLVFFPCQCLNFSFWLEKLKHYDYCYS